MGDLEKTKKRFGVYDEESKGDSVGAKGGAALADRGWLRWILFYLFVQNLRRCPCPTMFSSIASAVFSKGAVAHTLKAGAAIVTWKRVEPNAA
jgi:hypothetical protein